MHMGTPTASTAQFMCFLDRVHPWTRKACPTRERGHTVSSGTHKLTALRLSEACLLRSIDVWSTVPGVSHVGDKIATAKSRQVTFYIIYYLLPK